MIDLVLAHGTTSSPAGGGPMVQVVVGTLAAALVTAVMLFLVVGHRQGTVSIVGRAAALAERSMRLPGWAALPLSVLGGALLIAVFGMLWDISTHIDSGRDEGPFANASHYFILVGLFLVFFAGLLAVFLPKERPGSAAIRIREGWEAPVGGVLILICAAFSLLAFPLDDMWHRLFGQDVTLWGPTHLVLFGGAALSTLGAWVLFVEGRRARPPGLPKPSPWMRRFYVASFGGAFLIALSTFQGEFDFAVPQFRLILHPVLLMLAAGIALVAVRIHAGRGAALLAAGFFILVRGTIALLVGPVFGHTTLHFPLYLAEAAVVELVALRVSPDRPLRFGLIAGAAIGTVGLAAEWAWSYIFWTIEWPASLLPEAAIAGFVAAVSGSVLGALIGRTITPRLGDTRVPRLAVVAAPLAAIAVLVYATPMSEGDPVKATVQTTEVRPPPEREIQMTIKLDPPTAAEDAHWLNVTAWQGGSKAVVDPLKKIGPGTYRTTQGIPAHPNWKATLRLHKDSAVQGMAVYFPRDEGIPAGEIPAAGTFQREFVRDHELLQREQKDDVSGATKLLAYLVVLGIGAGLITLLALGLGRVGNRLPPTDRTPRPPAAAAPPAGAPA